MCKYTKNSNDTDIYVYFFLEEKYSLTVKKPAKGIWQKKMDEEIFVRNGLTLLQKVGC